MQLLSYLIPGIILGLINYFLLGKKKGVLPLITSLLSFVFLFNIVILSIAKFLMNKPNILKATTYTFGFLIKYVLFALILGIIYILLKGTIDSRIKFVEAKKASTKKSKILKVLSVIFVTIGGVFVFFSDWFIDYFGNITPEQFLFNLKSPIKGTSDGMVTEIITTPVFAIVSTVVVFIILVNFSYDIYLIIKDSKKKIVSKVWYDRVIFIISIVALVGGVTYGSNKLRLPEIAKAFFSDSTYIKDNYVDPRNVKMSFPAKKRNLIHIYLESVENSYFSKDLGGYMKVNLMPELSELSKEGISFSDNDKFGGPNQTYGSSWSVASMINMGVGIPLKIPMDGNSYGKTGTFLPGAIAIGDILEAQGYEQTIMFGADADFGGLTTYFKTHGDFNIFDLNYAREKGLIPKDYKVWWGFEDDKLYKFAKDEITRLSKTGKPFNFTMETADTHFPDGYLSKKAKTPHKEQYANVISYSTKEAVDFIKWIQKQPFYKDTTIVVTGDHLSMDKKFFKGWDKDYRRSVFNLILNPAVDTSKTKTKNREYAPLDFYPTILASMGIEVEGDRLGLGTNLFSDKETLIERDSIYGFEGGLSDNSNFFTHEFIDEDKTSDFKNTLVTQRKK